MKNKNLHEFWVFSKFGWTTFILTLILGILLFVQCFYLLNLSFVGNSICLILYCLIALLGVLTGFKNHIKELKEELSLSLIPAFFNFTVGVVFKILSKKDLPTPLFWICFIESTLVVGFFLRLSIERIGSWKFRQKRYHRLLDTMKKSNKFDPRVRNYLSLTCDKAIIDELKNNLGEPNDRERKDSN